MADFDVSAGDKASDAPVGLSNKRTKKRSGKRWGADVIDPSTARLSGDEALAENEGQATDPKHERGRNQPVQKSRKPRHKRWGPDKDAPDSAAFTEEPALMPASEAEQASNSAQQKPRRKRWGPDAATAEPVQAGEAADSSQTKAVAEPTVLPVSGKGRRKRWGPDEGQVVLTTLVPEPAQQAQTVSTPSDATEQADATAVNKKSKKRRWGPEEIAAGAVAAAAAPAAPAGPAELAPQVKICNSITHAGHCYSWDTAILNKSDLIALLLVPISSPCCCKWCVWDSLTIQDS